MKQIIYVFAYATIMLLGVCVAIPSLVNRHTDLGLLAAGLLALILVLLTYDFSRRNLN